MMNRIPLVYILFGTIVALSMVSPRAAEWLSLGLMVCAGIPHGSYDLRIAEEKWRAGKPSKKLILTAYLVGVLGMSGLCVFYPAVGLSLFLVISAAHFAEGEAEETTPRERLNGFLLGVGAILLPIGLHFSQARLYLSYFISASTLDLLAPSLFIAALITAGILAGVLCWDLWSCRRSLSREPLERLACLIGWILLPPLSGFAIWFIGRHSYHHLIRCQTKVAQTGSGISWDFIAISCLAIAGLLPFTVYFDFSQIDQLFTASLCLIAGLTLPHMVVCHDMERERILRETRQNLADASFC